MTPKKPDIFTIAYLASEFQAAVERKVKANPGLVDAFRKAATQQELGEMKKIAEILFENIPHDKGGNDDAVQAPRAALLVQLVDFYAAISLRVMKEGDVSALVPQDGRTQAMSDLFAVNKAQNLAKLFKPV
ncbi:MAG: hypothetical protein K8R48_05855 [Alphaproteobacteria bacterium]|nr:hypothetical protein [Alphaproteobacteria bacterium]